MREPIVAICITSKILKTRKMGLKKNKTKKMEELTQALIIAMARDRQGRNQEQISLPCLKESCYHLFYLYNRYGRELSLTALQKEI